MDTRDIQKATDSTKRLIQDENYYKYIFKKTERIVSIVFYILNSVEKDDIYKSHIEDITYAARMAHDAVLQSLEVRAHVAEDAVRASAHALIGLLSKLTVAQAAGMLSQEVVHVFSNEIDAVLRGMRRYIEGESAILGVSSDMTFDTAPKQRAVSQRTTPEHKQGVGTTMQASTVASTLDRRERIRTILEAKGEATIKDISELIKDCSEKTIQRELVSMIEDNVVKRQGSRRWSRYSLF